MRPVSGKHTITAIAGTRGARRIRRELIQRVFGGSSGRLRRAMEVMERRVMPNEADTDHSA